MRLVNIEQGACWHGSESSNTGAEYCALAQGC